MRAISEVADELDMTAEELERHRDICKRAHEIWAEHATPRDATWCFGLLLSENWHVSKWTAVGEGAVEDGQEGTALQSGLQALICLWGDRFNARGSFYG